ncbi:hypothetical protein [Rhizobium oryzicola]|uniref:Uncharacterized protein n=1 Tax=Rhizobium oryzicola TaxID=1232668 RepID=A0ABT8SX42_9HYPH|nr:hypothetical protein [Rhizobium oryzicola]MDO1583003.1 hypothetical protein [Rhizobium oryzicola]
MVDKIEKIEAVSPVRESRKDWSTSIDSEPDRAWVALRQEQITEDLALRNEEARWKDEAEDQPKLCGDEAMAQDRRSHPQKRPHTTPRTAEEEYLSGESPDIGTGNLDEDVPFGTHEGFV